MEDNIYALVDKVLTYFIEKEKMEFQRKERRDQELINLVEKVGKYTVDKVVPSVLGQIVKMGMQDTNTPPAHLFDEKQTLADSEPTTSMDDMIKKMIMTGREEEEEEKTRRK